MYIYVVSDVEIFMNDYLWSFLQNCVIQYYDSSQVYICLV